MSRTLVLSTGLGTPCSHVGLTTGRKGQHCCPKAPSPSDFGPEPRAARAPGRLGWASVCPMGTSSIPSPKVQPEIMPAGRKAASLTESAGPAVAARHVPTPYRAKTLLGGQGGDATAGCSGTGAGRSVPPPALCAGVHKCARSGGFVPHMLWGLRAHMLGTHTSTRVCVYIYTDMHEGDDYSRTFTYIINSRDCRKVWKAAELVPSSRKRGVLALPSQPVWAGEWFVPEPQLGECRGGHLQPREGAEHPACHAQPQPLRSERDLGTHLAARSPCPCLVGRMPRRSRRERASPGQD